MINFGLADTLNVLLGPSSLGGLFAEKYTARELLEKAGNCKKCNPAQQIFRVSKLWFSATSITFFSFSGFLTYSR